MREKKFPLQQSRDSRNLLTPRPWFPIIPRPKMAKVWKAEEKGSDMALGVHLVRDTFQQKFDVAAIITNDTDLCEPVRIVTEELNLPVVLLSPANKPAEALKLLATRTLHIGRNRLLQSQFPATIHDHIKGTTITSPDAWR